MNAEQYLQEHSLRPEFVTKSLGWQLSEDQITIPIYDPKGDLLYCRYRNFTGDAKFTADKGSHPALYQASAIKNKSIVVLCEGEPDCARLWQEGVPAVTGTSGVRTFSTALALPLKGKTVLVCLDTDEAGKSALPKYCEVLEQAGATVHVLSLPPEYKDISEYFTDNHTKQEFYKLPRLSLAEYLIQNEDPQYGLEEGTELMSREIPSEEWLIENVLPTEGFAFIVGAEATGKSFYTLTLAHSVSSGKDWLGHFPVKKQTKVLFIDKENTKRRTQTRMRGLHMSGKDLYWFKYPHFFEMSDEKEEDGFSKMIKSASRKVKQLGIGLIIVDSFADVMIGNENAAGDVQKFFDGMRQMFPDASILVLHHASKPAAGVPRTSAQLARGSTNIMAQIYSGFYSQAVPKSKTEFTLEQTKAGDAQKLNKFKVEMKVIPDYTNTSKTVVSELKYKGEVIDEDSKEDEAIEVITDALTQKSPMESKELFDICIAEGVSERSFRRAIKVMKDDLMLDASGNGKATKYSLINHIQNAPADEPKEES